MCGREVEKSGIVTVAGRGEGPGDAAVLGCALDGGKPGVWREGCTYERTNCSVNTKAGFEDTVLYCTVDCWGYGLNRTVGIREVHQ